MTVTNQNQKNIYVGDDSTLIFAYTFRIFLDSDLTVIIADTSVSPQTEQTLTLNQDYTVSGAGNPSGGNVTLIIGGSSVLTVPPTTTDNITLLRAVPITQLLDLITNDNFPSQSQEDAFDKRTFVEQQLQEQIDRSVKIPANITGVNVDLPEPVADQFIGWNSTADALINLPDPSVAAAASAAAAAASAAAALVSETNAASSEANALTSANNASTSETNAATSETNSANSAQYAQDWAITPEDTLVPAAAGGNLVDDYSALHHAAKAAASAAGVNIPVPAFPANEGMVMVARAAGLPGAAYTLEILGASTIVDDFTIKNNGGIISTAPFILDNIMLNAMQIAENGALTAGTMVDGFRDSYNDETGIDLGSSSNQEFEGGSYRTPDVAFSADTKLLLNFNEADGSLEIADSSGQGHVVTQVGNATLRSNHFVFGNGSLFLNTTDASLLNVAYSLDFDIFASAATSNTVDFWVKHIDANAVSSESYVTMGRTPGGANQLYSIYKTTGDDALTLLVRDSGADVINMKGGIIDDNEWHHIVYSKTADVHSFWIDGYQTAYVQDSSTMVITPTDDLRIGSWPNGTSNILNGYMDDLRITNNNAFSAAPIPQPFIHLSLDENAANTTVTDFGTGGNDGTTVGGNTETFHADGKVRFGFEFDGSSDYITQDGAAASIVGDTTGSFTFWFNPAILGNDFIFQLGNSSTDGNRVYLQMDSAGHMNLIVRQGNVVQMGANSPTPNSIFTDVWQHMAVVQDGVACQMYINGSAVTTTINTGAGTEWFTTATGLNRVTWGAARGATVSAHFNGRLDDCRYYSGVALTSTQVASIRNAGVAGVYGLGSPNISVPTTAHVDDANTLLLMHFDHLVQGEDLLDSSTGGAGSPHTVTSVNGAGAVGHFGNAHLELDGTGDYATVPNSTDFDIFSGSTGTISMWIRRGAAVGGIEGLFQNGANGTNQGFDFVFFGTGQQFRWGNSLTGLVNQTGASAEINDFDWHHMAFCQVDGDIAVYQDGTQVQFEGVVGTIPASASALQIGRSFATAGSLWDTTTPRAFNGDIDDVHFNTANLFSADPNDGLVILAGDDVTPGTMNLGTETASITVNGSLATTGTNTNLESASFNFDGTDDDIQIANGEWDITEGNDHSFTADMWIRTTTLGTQMYFCGSSFSATQYWSIGKTAGDVFEAQWNNSGLNWDLTGGTVASATWYHVAFVLVGNGTQKNVALYIDGTRVASGSSSANASYSDPLGIGKIADLTERYTGQMEGFRCGYSNFFDADPTDAAGITIPVAAVTLAQLQPSITVPAVAAVADANSVLLLNCNTQDESLSQHIPIFNGASGIEINGLVAGSNGALQLNGTNQFLSAPLDADFQFCNRSQSTLSNFFVMDVTSVSDDNMVSLMGVNLATDFQQFGKVVPGPNSLGTGYRRAGVTAVDLSSLPNSIVPGQVHHIVFTKNDGHHCMFLDGVQVCSDYDDVLWSVTGGGISGMYIGQRGDSTGYYPGKLDDIFMTDNDHFGVAAVDTPVLLTGEGADEDTSLINLGINRALVTFNSTAKLDDGAPTGPKFNATTSMFFNGSSDYLSILNLSTAKDRFGIGTSLTDDWTIDCWVNPAAVSAVMTIASQESVDAVNDYWQFHYFGGGTNALQFIKRRAGVNETTDGASVLPTNVWSHVAFVKSGANTAIYLNGVKDGSAFTWTTAQSANPTLDMNVGRRSVSGIQFWDGYIEQFRIIHSNIFGVTVTGGDGFTAPTAAIAAATLTVPTAPHVPTANTMFSLAFEPLAPFTDDSPTTPHTFTPSGSPTINGRFATGFLDLDGVDDDLQIPNHSDLEWLDNLKGDKTLHFWVRHNVTPTTRKQYFDHSSVAGPGNERIVLQHYEVGNVTRLITSVGGVNIILTTGTGITDNQWHHMAIVKLGSEGTSPPIAPKAAELQVYLDGVQIIYGSHGADEITLVDNDLFFGSTGAGNFVDGGFDAIQIVDNNLFSAVSSPGIADSFTVPVAEPALGATSGDIVLQSVAVAVAPALPAPDTIKIMLDLEDISPTVILNTDLNLEVSRDGGSTFTTATLAQTGQATNGRRLVEDEVDVSGQPDPGAGNSTILYRINTFNDVQMRFHGTSELWG